MVAAVCRTSLQPNRWHASGFRQAGEFGRVGLWPDGGAVFVDGDEGGVGVSLAEGQALARLLDFEGPKRGENVGGR
jgi:hypothetical protein